MPVSSSSRTCRAALLAVALSVSWSAHAHADDVRLGGVHLQFGLGAGHRDDLELRTALEAGMVLTTAPRPPPRGDTGVGESSGLVFGAAWAQGLDAVRSEAFGEVGWAVSEGYAGGVLALGPAMRLFSDPAPGASARVCAWAWALEACLRATQTFSPHPDTSALLLVGIGVN